jgi:hypothetical protein
VCVIPVNSPLTMRSFVVVRCFNEDARTIDAAGNNDARPVWVEEETLEGEAARASMKMCSRRIRRRAPWRWLEHGL